MFQFFITPDQIRENDIIISNEQDVNHIRNVLRMRQGQHISLCCQENSKEYICVIEEIRPDAIRASIEDINGDSR